MVSRVHPRQVLTSLSKQAAFLVLGGAVLIGCSAKAQADPPAASAAVKADDENPTVWKPRIRSVAVFKNGLGFFMREGEAQLRDGWCLTEQVPPAAFGTLAIYSRNDKETVDVVGSGPGEVVEFDGRDAAKDAATRRVRLEAAKFLKVQLTSTTTWSPWKASSSSATTRSRQSIS